MLYDGVTNNVYRCVDGEIEVIPQTLVPNEMGRLFFLCFTSSGAPYVILKPVHFTGTVWRRHIQAAGGNWLSADHLGIPWPEITPSVDTDPLDAGRFIQWYAETGKRNLYSIDVAYTHITDAWDTDAVRLQLSGSNLIFVPYVHPIVRPVVV